MKTLSRSIGIAVLGGLVVAAILWAVGGGPREARAVVGPEDGPEDGPDATDVRAATTGRRAPAFRARPGTTRIVARAEDVAGGPDWVVERFVLRGRPFAPYVRIPKGPVSCVRLGRAVGGRVAWIDALGRRGTVARERHPTICTVDAQGRDVQTYAVLDARGGRVRRSALVTFGFGRGTDRGDRRLRVHGRDLVLPRGARGFLRVDRPVAGETPVRAAAPPRPQDVTRALPPRLRARVAREQRLNVAQEVEHPRFVSQSGTAVGTVGIVVGRMPGRRAACVASGVTEGFLGTAGELRGPLGVVEVAPVFQCERIRRGNLAGLPSANQNFLRARNAAGRQVTLSTAQILAPPGVDRVELRTVAGVQTIRVVPLGPGPGIAVGVWPQAGAGQDDFGPSVEVVGIRPDGSRVEPKGGYVDPPPPTEDVRGGP